MIPFYCWSGILVAFFAKLKPFYGSVEKTRQYFLWVLVVSLVAVVLPAIGLIFAIPQFLGLYQTIGNL